MIPWPKLKTISVTRSVPPQSRVAARIRSVRGERPRSQMSTTMNTRAAGSSHAIWPPQEALNIRQMPVGPQALVAPPAAPPPGTTLPVSLPVIRPRPL